MTYGIRKENSRVEKRGSFFFPIMVMLGRDDFLKKNCWYEVLWKN